MITVLIADDAAAVRKSLRAMLEATDDIRVTAEADNGVEAVRLARALHPDVVLMDLRMPGGDGLDAIEALAGMGVPDPLPVLALTTFHLDEYVYGALHRGAVGFLLKKNPGDIPAAIRAAVNARALNSPAIRERLIDDYARGSTRVRAREATPAGDGTPSGGTPTVRPGDESLTEALTGRELEVAAALADGLSNQEIATRLGLGASTVKWHIANMLDKTGARDRTQLAIWAYQRGLNP